MTQKVGELDVEKILRAALAEAEPPQSVEDRIVRGAMARATSKQRFRRWVPGMVVAFGLGLVVFWAAGVDLSGHDQGVVAAAGRTHTPKDVPTQYVVGAHKVDVSEGAEMQFDRVASSDTALTLKIGRITCEVTPLTPGGSFRVHTRDGEVRVIGTRFVVEVLSDCTYVTVLKGSVWLTETLENASKDRRLDAGQQGAMCATEESAGVDGQDGREWVHEALVLVSNGEHPEKAAELLRRYLDTYPGGLFEEDAMFHLVFLMRNLGKEADARELVEQFCPTFPGSRRAEELRQLFEIKSK
jgi:ferric-dicitrate binding protein FerR (iron transport regulator)